jgi:hypothetical protein
MGLIESHSGGLTVTDEAPEPSMPANRKHNKPVIAVLALLIFVAIAACAWFMYYPTTPRYATGRFLEAAKARDYDAVYAAINMPDTYKRVVPDGNALKRIIETAPSTFPQIASFAIGDTAVTGDDAIVKASLTTTGGSSASDIEVHLRRVDGRWMVDGNWLAGLMARNGGGALLKMIGPHLLGL